jgi:4-hydroxy-tetrahydrodipicolinate synthase
MCIGRHVWKLSGYAPALPTPFDENDAVDAAAFEHVCEFQISNGATALVVGATTGEAPNLSAAEHRKLLRIAIGVSRGRVPIIAGAGSNSTEHAIELTENGEARARMPSYPSCHTTTVRHAS